MAYTAKIYKGDYSERQKAANADKCICYVEHHFNANAGSAGNYTVVIVGSKSSETSKKWGRLYAKKVSDAFDVPLGGTDGILVGGYGGRGDGNISKTTMPAILVEPLFVNNDDHAAIVKSDDGQNKLAQILVDTIKEIFPKGGLVGMSIGHKYKTSKPKDRGAAVVGGGTEADYVEIIINKAVKLLQGSK